ncbi:hypothetical protein BS47DRAFT_127249 [Hydnum rufescens UP504]|uniref:Uncharacterized protein n=1 Tax=Hydnum rufescens UP504 TaxID=1448309 RepID=A0A9P6DQ89_9AGAM|nr:hypothetical protein BS47DRAFT_127249 [Hydnum rufescens UP504]
MPSRRLLSRIRPAVSSESPQPNDPTLGGLTDSAPQAAYPDCTNENASPGWVAAVAVRLIRGDLPKLPGPVAGPLGQLLDVVSGILDAVEAMREEDECKHLIFRALKFLQSLVDHLRGSNVPIAEGAPIHAAAFALNMCLMEIRDDAHWWSQLITTVTLDKIKIVISRNPMDAFCFVMTLRVLMSSINTISDSAAALQPSSDLFFLSQSWYPIYPWREKVLKSKDTARSYALIEARLYKNEHNAEHEFVIAEFRGNAGVIFAAAERVTTLKDSDHNMSDEECDRTLKELKAEDERKRQKEREEQKRKEKQQTSKTTNFRKTLSFPMKPAPESSLLLSFSASLAERAMSVDDRIRLILGSRTSTQPSKP